MTNRLFLSLCYIFLASVPMTASAALMQKYIGTGTGAVVVVYDDYLDITWLGNANLAVTETFGVSGINAAGTFREGAMTWNTAIDWVSAMNLVENSDGSTGYKGYTGWRLPATFSASSIDSEMGHLFDVDGITSASPCSISSPGVCFDNVQDFYYWSGTEGSESLAYSFSFDNGVQSLAPKSDINFKYFAWAVHDGDIGIVPVPAAAWLFMSGLIGLVGFARRGN